MCKELLLNRRAALAALGAVAGSWPASAAGPWQAKPPAEWSAGDWRKLLNDSPWAANVQVTVDIAFKPLAEEPETRAAAGNCCFKRGGLNNTVASTTPEAPLRMPERTARAFVRWRSARPIRLAVLRTEQETKDKDLAQLVKLVEPEAPAYVIEVTLPRVDSQNDSSAPAAEADVLQRSALLRRHGRGARAPIGVMLPSSGNPSHAFYFSRTPAITLADKEIEFSLNFGLIELKHKFKLKEMVYQGRLEI